MAPAFRSNDMTINSTANAACTVTAPASIADDDILIFALDRAIVVDAITLSGFTELFRTQHTGGSLYCGWKRASSESGDYQATWTGNSNNVGIMYAISGVFTDDPPVVAGITVLGENDPDPPSVDPGTSKDRLAIVLVGQESKGGSMTEPSGYTEPATNSDGSTSGAGSPSFHSTLALAYRTYTGQTEDPGVFTPGSSGPWATNTLIFEPETPVSLLRSDRLARFRAQLRQ